MEMEIKFLVVLAVFVVLGIVQRVRWIQSELAQDEKQLIRLGLELELEKSKVEGLRREWQKEKAKVQELESAQE
jgi:hypothetical protein